MTIASHVDQILRQYGKSDDSCSLQARVIELLVSDPRVTSQGLRTSLRQQARLFHQQMTHSSKEVVEKMLHDIIDGLQLHGRIGADAIPGRPEQTQRSSGSASKFRRRTANGSNFAKLAEKYPWPQERPVSAVSKTNHFTQSGTLALLDEAMDELQPRLIVEVGAWLGGTTRWLLGRTPHNVISIDTWLGSSEHQVGTAWEKREPHHAQLLDRLFETFLANCWEFRDRLIALRTTSLDGFWQIAQAGLRPDIVLLDGAHDEISVSDELELAYQLFPAARLIIDDYNCRSAWLRGLVRAVDQFAVAHRLTIVEANQHSCMLVN